MTIETVAVAFLRAYVAWAKAKHITRGLSCTDARMSNDISAGHGPCPDEFGRNYPEEWCDNCRKREPLMAERRDALKTYQQARRRALRVLQKDTP